MFGMKWLVFIAGVLTCNTLWAQEKERFWYSMTNDYESTGLFTWTDSTGKGWSIMATRPKNGWRPKDSTMYIANRNDTSLVKTPITLGETGYQVATYWSEDSIELNNLFLKNDGHQGINYPSRTRMKRVGEHIYFINLAHDFSFEQKFFFYKEYIDFGQDYGPSFSVQVIQTDLQLNVLNARRYRSSFNTDRYAVDDISEDADGQPQFTLNRYSGTTYDGFSLDKYLVQEDSTKQQFNIIRLHQDLQLDTLVTIKNPKDISSRLLWLFSIGTHIKLESKDAENHSVYVIQKLNKDFDIEVIDTMKTNLTINSLSIRNNRLWIWWETFTASKELPYLNGEQLGTDNHFKRYLTSFTSDGKLATYLPFQNHISSLIVTTSAIQENEDLYWIKIVASRSSITVGDSSFVNDEPGGQIYYLAIDFSGNIRQVLKGPKTDLFYGYNYSTLHLSEGVLHDLNTFTDNFSYGSFYSNLPERDFPGSRHLVYTETPIILPPKQKPIASITLSNCNTAQIQHRRTDAEHYTLVVSENETPRLPQNGENYNFSYNYLRASKLGKHTRVLYQGRDTSLKVYNLVSGRRYHFALVPGNGPSGNTAYNRDSIDTFSLYIPSSPWQDSLTISPGSDTSICASDTLYFSGKSPFPLRWMDGKESALRMLEQSGNYYFTSKDPLECVLSSDTAQLLLHQLPEVYSLEIASAPPYCLGDTLLLRAKSNGNYVWPDGSTDSTMLVTQTGFYDFISRSPEGCETRRSIEVQFDQYPKFRFDVDAPLLGYGGTIDVRYRSNADSLSWHIDGFADTAAPKGVLIDSCLRVEAFSKTGCLTKDSIEVRNYELQSSIFPNAFSPNGDGVNDVWHFVHPDTLGKLTIYNRMGAVVHTGPLHWDGTRLGEELPMGAYEYVFWHNMAGKRERIEGTVYLLR